MKARLLEMARYVVNGLVATAIHYAALTANLHWFGFRSAGAANLAAAVVGITASFLGSRYYVFRHGQEGSISRQAIRFGGLYGLIAVLHGLTLLLWTDIAGFDYRLGFLVATALQMMLSYLGNRLFVFK